MTAVLTWLGLKGGDKKGGGKQKKWRYGRERGRCSMITKGRRRRDKGSKKRCHISIPTTKISFYVATDWCNIDEYKIQISHCPPIYYDALDIVSKFNQPVTLSMDALFTEYRLWAYNHCCYSMVYSVSLSPWLHKNQTYPDRSVQFIPFPVIVHKTVSYTHLTLPTNREV